ncbi:glycosyltransferase [Halorubrum sp. AS12]|uniref:glycosyltransferase n=1 Tax=Halorubrum sp. AS12 TaxID=3409687 RepID=UPI003DA7471E
MTDICIAHGGDIGEPNGGTDRVTALAAGLSDRGYDVTLVVPTPSNQLDERFSDLRIESIDLPTHGVSTQPRRAYQISKRAIEVADKENAKLQFEHSTLAGVGTFRGVSDFVLDIHDLAFRSPLYGELPMGSIIQRFIEFVEGRAIHRANNIVVVSKLMKEIIVEQWKVPVDDIIVVPNGYFEHRIAPYRSVETVPSRVAFLGTLHPKLDIEAMYDIARLPEVDEFVVIGDGNRREDLESASKQIDSLSVTGRLPDEKAFQLVSSAAVAVNPQFPSELQATSSPVKLYYYAGLGVPSVVTEGPELATDLEAAGAAKVVSPNEDFDIAVRELLNSKDRRESMKQSARRAAETFQWSRRAAQFAEVYEPVVDM